MVRRDMPTRGFFDRLLLFGEQLYYSRAILEASAELAEVKPSGSMWVDRHAAGNSTTLWLGGNGVETALHYDMSFRQRRREALLPLPTLDASPPPPFPPTTGDLYQRWSSGRGRGRSDALVAQLLPGDVLYIPPLWFHSALALGRLSVGVNMWSNSVEGTSPASPTCHRSRGALLALEQRSREARAPAGYDRRAAGRSAPGGGSHGRRAGGVLSEGAAARGRSTDAAALRGRLLRVGLRGGAARRVLRRS